MPTLHNLQLFLLPHTETLARASATSARLYFLAGPRLITYLSSTHNSLHAAAAKFSCGAAAVPERVEQVVEDRKRTTKRVDDLEAELARVIAKEIFESYRDPTKNEGGGQGVVLHKHRVDDTSNALQFLSSISMAFANEVAARTEQSQHLIVLTSSPPAQTANSTTVVMIFGDDEKQVKAMGDLLKVKLGVKGGGKGAKWSGKFTGVWNPTKEGTVVEKVLRG